MEYIKWALIIIVVAILGGAIVIWKQTDWQSPKPKSVLLTHTYIGGEKECTGFSFGFPHEDKNAPELRGCLGILK